ncbi:malectin domain-containing carbohydrate-binding protein [Halegenticoccus soli]|uniref:malectin domain-containing carbohydrate-binding protein n=1 Tax=Halegenticoccus soli TaxID=1985678 RepID=UPI000C6CA416|nr:malectin domain-containing carbohydrate-binding protein [Halegenticoccus soli]
MSASSRSSPNDTSSSARQSASWIHWVLLGIGGLFFLTGILVAAGVPDVPLGGPVADDGDTPSPTPETGDDSTPADANAGSDSATADADGDRRSGDGAQESDPPSATGTTPPAGTATPTSTAVSSPTPGAVAEPVYRVNVGGPRIGAADGPDWSPDRADDPSPYLNSGGSDTVAHYTPDRITVDDGVPPTAPRAMFKTYRFDRGSADGRYEEMIWRFPVDPNREYEVRLYFLEAFFTDGDSGREYEKPYAEGGPRSFGVAVDGEVVLRNYEPFREHGHDVGGVKSFRVTAEDGVIEIRFLREAENPTVSGFEIVDTGPRNGGTGGNSGN